MNSNNPLNQTNILLVNLGSTDAATPKAVRKYLKEFLSDSRVVDLPRLLWLPILHGIILNTRPKKVAKAYAKIWGQHQLSPLVRECKEIVTQLNDSKKYSVHLAMRYGKPSIKSTLDSIGDCEQLIIIPMFPQYSSATSASVFDAVSAYYSNKRYVPEIKFVNNYHQNPFYIKALAQSIKHHWHNTTAGEKLIISFHGLPQRFVKTGDKYQQHCEATASLLAKELKLHKNQWLLTYQSRFGKEPWLQPYTDETLQKLAEKGIKKLDIISPGFSVDCLETLEELAMEGKEIFVKAGGEELNYIPALNSNPEHIKMWQKIIKENLD